MAIYQKPSARLCECLRNAGVVVLFIVVLKGFLSSTDTFSSRQASVETKGLRAPSELVSTADVPAKDEIQPGPSTPPVDDDGDDDDDAVVDTGSIIIDGDDDDQADGPTVTVSLHLIGERHSGTKWMSKHLQDCFPNVHFTNNPFRWKHWFQDESIQKFPGERFVVVAQFRNPYTWTEAMRSFPHHAPMHFHLDWPEFVTRSWTMPRKAADLKFTDWNAETSRDEQAPMCASGEFLPHQVIPCMADRNAYSTRGIHMKALYELRNDGSGKPYNNILDMRQKKIENFLSVADFERVQDVYVVRYEEAKLHGTAKLVEELETALDQKASCKPVKGDPAWRERSIPDMFREYLKSHVNWDAEAKIGYFPTDAY